MTPVDFVWSLLHMYIHVHMYLLLCTHRHTLAQLQMDVCMCTLLKLASLLFQNITHHYVLLVAIYFKALLNSHHFPLPLRLTLLSKLQLSGLQQWYSKCSTCNHSSFWNWYDHPHSEGFQAHRIHIRTHPWTLKALRTGDTASLVTACVLFSGLEV